MIGIFLSAVSFVKWIQILMFIPALVISLFLYSFIEVQKLKRNIKCSLLKEWENYIVSIVNNSKSNFFLRVWYKNWNDIFLLNQVSVGNFFNIPNKEEIEIILFLKWTFDILRNVINIWKISHLWSSKINRSIRQDYNDNTFFFIREYEPWDNIGRLDSIKSALKNSPFIKSIINFEFSKWNKNKNDNWLKLIISSNNIILAKDETKKWNILKWLLILINFIVIYIEWEYIFYNLQIILPSIFVFIFVYKKKFILKNLKLLTFLVFILFLNMMVMTFAMKDMAWPCSVFFTQILIIKQLFSDEREDGFLYIFLSLFVFVAVSLSSVELWFILFFLLYLIIAVFLLTSVSGYMVTDSIKWAFWTKISNFKIFKITILIFVIMTFLFFLLPHWNTKINQTGTLTPTNIDNITWFSEELNFENIWEIKKDNSKVIVVDNLTAEDKDLLKNKYWRWERFFLFRGNSWTKSDKKMAYIDHRDSITNNKKILSINYIKKWKTNLFFPNIPKSIIFWENNEYYSLRLSNIDNSIYYLSNRNNQTFNLKVAFDTNKQWKLIDSNIRYNFIYSWSIIDKNTSKLFNKFWSQIDIKIYNNPSKIVDYIKNKYWFEYSIDSPAKNITDFLYGSKKWYCEYYSTVLALTLQHYWYNATVVNWYYSWEWNSIANSWIIRWKEAHSWVEVYSNNSWQIYDATPAEIIPTTIPFYTKSWNYIVSIYDYFDIKWYAYIVNYTWDAQKELLLWILNFQKEIIILFSFFILLIIFKYLYNLYKIDKSVSYEEKLLKFLKKMTKSKYPLDFLLEIDKSLVAKSREKIFKNTKLSYDDYIILKTDWKKYFLQK